MKKHRSHWKNSTKRKRGELDRTSRTNPIRYYTACNCCLSIFYKNKASRHKQRQLNWCFLSLFYFLSIISAFVTNIMTFIEPFARLRICLFRYVTSFCRNLAKLVILVQFQHYVLVPMMSVQPYLLQTNSSSPFRLSEP